MFEDNGDGIVMDAARQLRICNACRYCEGYCAVWNAIERRANFTKTDIYHLSNLCHDCRECYYVCPFNEPHEYGLNIPKTLSIVRRNTYQEFSVPTIPPQIYNRIPSITIFLTFLSVIGLFSYFVMNHGFAGMYSSYVNLDNVIPLNLFRAISFFIYAYVIVLWFLEGNKYWRKIRGDRKIDLKSVLKATWDVIAHKNFRGGGAGCSYPNEKGSRLRLFFHPMVFFGFIIDWITILFYPFSNIIPLIFYTFGSVLIFIGSAALLTVKGKSDKAPENSEMSNLDYPFTVLLFLTGLTGVIFPIILGFPEWVMFFLLHDAFIFVIFLMAPFSKFIHPVFRYLSLLLNRIEETADI